MSTRTEATSELVELVLTPAQIALEAQAHAFARDHVLPREHEHSDEFAREITAELGRAGLLDACVDLDVRAICLLREAIAYASGVADSMLALQGLGYGPLALAGSDAQRSEWRERVRTGQAIAAIAITEPEAGSDVGAISTRAERVGDHWVLNGEKCFITNAGLADFYTVFARTSADASRGLSCFLVPAAGVKVTERYEIVAPHPSGAIAFENTRVPTSALVGEVGQGFKLAMMTLDRFRCTVGAAALGMAQRALDEAIARSKSRVQFGKPLSTFQQIQAYLADSWAELEAARLLVYRAAYARDVKDEAKAGRYASAAKMLATETAQRVIDRSVQIHGGLGVKRGTPVERLYREVRALRIYEGTTEIQKLVLSRSLLGG